MVHPIRTNIQTYEHRGVSRAAVQEYECTLLIFIDSPSSTVLCIRGSSTYLIGYMYGWIRGIHGLHVFTLTLRCYVENKIIICVACGRNGKLASAQRVSSMVCSLWLLPRVHMHAFPCWAYPGYPLGKHPHLLLYRSLLVFFLLLEGSGCVFWFLCHGETARQP